MRDNQSLKSLYGEDDLPITLPKGALGPKEIP